MRAQAADVPTPDLDARTNWSALRVLAFVIKSRLENLRMMILKNNRCSVISLPVTSGQTRCTGWVVVFYTSLENCFTRSKLMGYNLFS